MKKNKTLRFFVTLLIVLAILGSLVVGGYFILDKAVVPKYFGEYGINNMGDLVEMMGTLYNNNDESDIVTNPFRESDKVSAENKLIEVGFPVLANGNLDYKKVAEGQFEVSSEASVELTDKELASIVGEMLNSGVLAEKLPNLRYLNTLTFTMLEVIITPDVIIGEEVDPNSAHMEFTVKIDTSSVRTQMANEMEMPLFLLNMIVPKTLYISVEFDLSINEGEWVYTNSSIGVNGRTSKQSEILLNLLIDFIFPPEDQMTLERLNEEFGGVIINGLELLGNVQFTNSIYSTSQNGVILTFK